MIKLILGATMNFAGLLMLVIVWGADNVPVLIVPGVFGLVASPLYLGGMLLMLLWAREGHR